MSRLELLTKWNRMIVRLQIEHEISARDFEKFSWKLGIPCVVLSAIVSASVFGSISDSSPVWLQYVAGVLSLLTLVLSSVQTFLNFDTRAAGHKDTAEKLGAMQAGELPLALAEAAAGAGDNGDEEEHASALNRSHWNVQGESGY